MMDDTMTAMTEEELQERIIKAVTTYLERKGCNLIEVSNTFSGLIAEDEDEALVFVEITKAMGADGFSECRLTREEAEKLAAQWLMENGDDYVDTRIRFDLVKVMIIGKSKAFLSHHINRWSNPQ